MLEKRLTVQDLQEQELRRSCFGFQIIDDIEAKEAAQAAEFAKFPKGIKIEAVIPGEYFTDVSRTIYEDPDFIGCFDDLMERTTIREKAICLSEYLAIYSRNTDIVDMAALEALPQLGLEAARQFLSELQDVAPQRNWAECIAYVRETLAS
ncbi:MAG: hypothetical protein ACK5MU_02450 [Candidatus Saccharimonadales bacterium]